MKGIWNGKLEGSMKEGDVVMLLKQGKEGGKELSMVLSEEDMGEEGMKRMGGLEQQCMSGYDG